ncbi:ribokinase [Phenylobacterium terrae]|uniref:Ribokinase n=1 Tax=Phenylobacterium terrae TaxID=2665495 RepID=A0ABW4N5T3_9CAUL
MSGPPITVVGSINLDFVAQAPKLPAPGETVTGARLARHPGGKGANQALAARRLGAQVALVGRVGADAMADEALALLRADGVDLSDCAADPHAPTGVALIAVSPDGENQIVVASGANAAFTPDRLPGRLDGALICQLELPIETVAAAVERAEGFVCLNLAPAAPVPEALLRRAELIVVNETEAAACGERLAHAGGLVAVTYGRRGAELRKAGDRIAEARPPQVEAVDSTGAGDAFVAALTLALLEGREPEAALAFACAAGALAATRRGAQPSLPRRDQVEACLAARPAP